MKELNFDNNAVQELKIGGKTYKVTMDDLDVIDAFEDFRAAVIECDKKRKNGAATRENIHSLAKACIAAAEAILGEGSSNKVFGDTLTFDKCVKFGMFMLEVYSEYWTGKRGEYEKLKNAVV